MLLNQNKKRKSGKNPGSQQWTASSLGVGSYEINSFWLCGMWNSTTECLTFAEDYIWPYFRGFQCNFNGFCKDTTYEWQPLENQVDLIAKVVHTVYISPSHSINISCLCHMEKDNKSASREWISSWAQWKQVGLCLSVLHTEKSCFMPLSVEIKGKNTPFNMSRVGKQETSSKRIVCILKWVLNIHRS